MTIGRIKSIFYYKIQWTRRKAIYKLKREITIQIQNEVSKWYKEIELENKMLKKHMAGLRKIIIENQSKNKELEKYGRCLCLHMDSISVRMNQVMM